ncbi:MAG TPA: hypothetical protein ENN09_05185 [Planctomycetes bacterium]|nr:hypothetical protein [Planctomycetota bacterium]
MVSVKVITPEGVHKARMKAARVGDVLEAVRSKAPGLAALLLEGMTGRYYLVVKVNGADARFQRYLDTPVSPGDKVDILVNSRDRERILKELYLTFGRDTLGQPLLHEAGRMFGVVLNIRGASISSRRGFAHVEVEGPSDEISALMDWFVHNGVRVEEAGGKKI